MKNEQKTEQNESIYVQMLKTGCKMDSHESDLYVEVTPETKVIVNSYKYKSNVKMFVSQIEKTLWYDIPFAYIPFWEKKPR
jgi:esterase/lipase superfamily enzyme